MVQQFSRVQGAETALNHQPGALFYTTSLVQYLNQAGPSILPTRQTKYAGEKSENSPLDPGSHSDMGCPEFFRF